MLRARRRPPARAAPALPPRWRPGGVPGVRRTARTARGRTRRASAALGRPRRFGLSPSGDTAPREWPSEARRLLARLVACALLALDAARRRVEPGGDRGRRDRGDDRRDPRRVRARAHGILGGAVA